MNGLLLFPLKQGWCTPFGVVLNGDQKEISHFGSPVFQDTPKHTIRHLSDPSAQTAISVLCMVGSQPNISLQREFTHSLSKTLSPGKLAGTFRIQAIQARTHRSEAQHVFGISLALPQPRHSQKAACSGFLSRAGMEVLKHCMWFLLGEINYA